jgi:hypothetical protein
VSIARYFVTDQEEAAKNWEMLQNGKALIAKVARLQDELRRFSLDWSLLGKLAADSSFSYRVDGERIEILCVDVFKTRDDSSPQFREESSVLAKHFDLPAITALLTELTGTKRELALAKSELRKLGVDL